jgi:hypothetical protein
MMDALEKQTGYDLLLNVPQRKRVIKVKIDVALFTYSQMYLPVRFIYQKSTCAVPERVNRIV